MTVLRDMLFDPSEWLCVGQYCCRAPLLFRGTVTTCVHLARMAVPERIRIHRWIRYWIDLADTPPVPVDVRLSPVTDDVIRTLRAHPDLSENQLTSGLRFWDHGLRRAYIWMGQEGPRCIQWLLTSMDNSRLRTLPDWAGMYPPLPPGVGQVENLFTFSSGRRRGVATQFEDALYEEARMAGLRHLITHISEPNTAARGWAARTGWRAYGTIIQCQLHLPGGRARSVFLHRNNAMRRAAQQLPTGEGNPDDAGGGLTGSGKVTIGVSGGISHSG